MTEPAGLRSLVIQREMPHPPEKVWRALTQGPLIEAWLMANDFQLILGHKFNFRSRPMPHWNGVTDCEVLVIETNRTLAYSWNSSGNEAANGLKTVVTWTLSPTPTGTLVRMEQSGFKANEDANYNGANYGWQKYIGSLETIVGELA